MARGALNWSMRDLAGRAGLAHNTIVSFEMGRTVRPSSVDRIRDVFERHGITFASTPAGIAVALAS